MDRRDIEHLYRAKSMRDDWLHLGHRFDGVEVRWVVHEAASASTEEEDVRRLLDALDVPWQHLQLNDCLTASQLAGLREHLEGRAELQVEALTPPIAGRIRGSAGDPFSAMRLGGTTFMYALWQEPGYRLPDRIAGCYRIDGPDVEHSTSCGCDLDPAAGYSSQSSLPDGTDDVMSELYGAFLRAAKRVQEGSPRASSNCDYSTTTHRDPTGLTVADPDSGDSG